MKLRIKLALSFTVIIIVVTGTIAVLSIYRETKAFKEELKKQGLILTSTLADECGNAFITNKFVHVMDYIDTIAKQEYVVYVMVRDNKGKVKAHDDISKIGAVITNASLHAVHGTGPYTGTSRSDKGEDMYELAVPVAVGGNVVGLAQVGYSLRSLKKSTAKAIKHIIVITIAGIITGIIFMLILSQQLVKPITKLKDAANAIAKGDFSTKIDVTAKDEIGELSGAFKQMAIDLSTSQDELVRATYYTDNIIESMIDTLIVVDTEGVIKKVNKATLDLLEYTQEELLGRPLEHFFPELPVKGTKLQKLIEHGRLENYETYSEAKNGKKNPVLFRASAMRDQDGAIMNFVCTATDITENRRLRDSLQKSERQLRTLSSSLLAAQEQERKRISRELHDDLGQIVTAVLLDVTRARKLELPHASDIYGSLERIQARAEEALQRVRSLSAMLRPGVLDQLGLKAAAVSLLEDMRERTELNVIEEIHVDHSDIPESVSIAVYRILQEAMTNIVKHAEATQVTVRLQSGRQTVALSVTDNGRGFDPASLAMDQGLGLMGMQERAECLGGVFRIESAPGQGTTFYTEIPLSAEKMAT